MRRRSTERGAGTLEPPTPRTASPATGSTAGCDPFRKRCHSRADPPGPLPVTEAAWARRPGHFGPRWTTLTGHMCSWTPLGLPVPSLGLPLAVPLPACPPQTSSPVQALDTPPALHPPSPPNKASCCVEIQDSVRFRSHFCLVEVEAFHVLPSPHKDVKRNGQRISLLRSA